MKLWGARFQKETDQAVNDFNSSIRFDSRMYQEDIAGSIAHVTMLGRCGIITEEEAADIAAALQEILRDIEAGKLTFTADAEDIHMNIETILTQRLGDLGKKLHTARSRNDQVAVDLRLYLRKEIKILQGMLKDYLSILCNLAEQHADTVMPGYTHLQRAQPVTLGHHLMAYAQMGLRDLSRLSDCLERMDEMPLGSGALATTTYPINRFVTAELLGFRAPCANSMDGVSDRDYVIELAADLSLIMMHLSRFCEEIILWCSAEFSFVELDDAYSTGSSIMPQKKNPDVAELVRGKTGRVYGSLIALLTMMKGLPLAYNKDMQEDKEPIFDAVDTVKLCLPVFCGMIQTARFRADRMADAAAGGFTNATDCADYLVRHGMPFRDAYKVVGKLVARCLELSCSLDTLSIAEYQAASSLFSADVYESIATKACVAGRRVYGGPATVAAQVAQLRQKLNQP